MVATNLLLLLLGPYYYYYPCCGLKTVPNQILMINYIFYPDMSEVPLPKRREIGWTADD